MSLMLIVDLNILTIEELIKRKDEKIRGKKKNLPLLNESYLIDD